MTVHRTIAVKAPKGSPSTAEARNSVLITDRNVFLDSGKEYSRFTLPYVLPLNNDGTSRGAGANQHGFQSIGAQAVNHLSNKLVINMFPVDRSFFRTKFNEVALAALKKGGYDTTTLSELLVKAEEKAADYQQKVAARVAYTEAMKSLIICGNVLMYGPAGRPLQAIKLDRYVVQRDLSGEVQEIITTQEKSFSALSPDIVEGLKQIKGKEAPEDDDKVTIYTWIVRQPKGLFTVAQAVEGIAIKDPVDIKEEDLPWIPLRWNSTNGEDYGRGHVEDNSGDFYVIEFLSEAVVKGMALMADIKYLVRPGSETDIDEVAGAPTGEWLFGNIEDIGILQLERYADYTPIKDVLAEYQRRIGQAFLLNSAVRRDAERVTTVELRIDAQELETSLGGVYGLLSETMQKPLAKMFLNNVGFPLVEQVTPDIITGLAAFGKSGDLDKIRTFTEMMQLPLTWPEQVQRDTKFDIYAREIASALSMETPWTMTKEEKAERDKAEQAARQEEGMQEAMVKSAPEMLKQGMDNGGQA